TTTILSHTLTHPPSNTPPHEALPICNYVLSGLANGTYTVTPTKTSVTFSPASSTVTINGANVTAVNFTATASSGISIDANKSAEDRKRTRLNSSHGSISYAVFWLMKK